MTAYYNENDKFAVEWLRLLIAEKVIADGEVDSRSIEEVAPEDLRGFTQCHFFAGIGVWSYALRAAGWSDSDAVWTGSCPCQSFSASGKREGFSDKRHLWPAWFRLIGEHRPVVLFGEQVASKDGLAWFDVVSSDMEGTGYTIGACDTCAAGYGAPHLRQRLYFVAESSESGRTRSRKSFSGRKNGDASSGNDAGGRGENDRMADNQLARCDRSAWKRLRTDGQPLQAARPEQRNKAGLLEHAELRRPEQRDTQERPVSIADAAGNVGESSFARLERHGRHGDGRNESRRFDSESNRPTATAGFWSDCDWLPCTDGFSRPVEPGTFPLVNGYPNRVGTLRGYGNALVAPQAQAFIEAYLELTELPSS